MFESRGRKNKEAYVDGGYYIVKKPVKISNSVCVFLPKDWLDMVSMGREVKYFLLDVKDLQVVVKPYFDNIPLLDND